MRIEKKDKSALGAMMLGALLVYIVLATTNCAGQGEFFCGMRKYNAMEEKRSYDIKNEAINKGGK